MPSNGQRHSEQGNVVSEAAIAVPVVIVAFTLAIQIVFLQFTKAALNHTLAREVRKSGIVATVYGTSKATLLEQAIIAKANGLKIKLTAANVKICPLDEPTCTADNAGTPGSHIRVSASYKFNVLGLYPTTITASVIGRNEGHV
jgi:hypothetical protein